MKKKAVKWLESHMELLELDKTNNFNGLAHNVCRYVIFSDWLYLLNKKTMKKKVSEGWAQGLIKHKDNVKLYIDKVDKLTEVEMRYILRNNVNTLVGYIESLELDTESKK